MTAVEFDFSGVRVRIEGTDDLLAAEFAERWGRFSCAAEGRPALAVRVRTGDSRFRHGPVLQAKRMRSRFRPDSAMFSMPEGEIEAAAAGTAEAVVGDGPPRHRALALQNLILATLAWILPSRATLIVHAAGIVRGGRAFALVGTSGAGKSTWALAARDAGCDVLSEDLVWIDASGSPTALSVPFRPDVVAPMGPGRLPLAAVLFPIKGAPPRLDAVDPLVALGRLVANLPFVAERHGRDPGLDRAVDALLAGVAVRALTFPPDASFLDVLDELP